MSNSDFKKKYGETSSALAQDVECDAQENKKLLVGLLAIFMGSLGVHKFILGYTKEGFIQIIISIITCGFGSIIPFIEGIIYLKKSDKDFYNTYQLDKRGWF